VISRKTRWVRHVARVEKGEMHIGFMWRNLEEKDPWDEPYRDGRIILI
jgi:hypothetical protein